MENLYIRTRNLNLRSKIKKAFTSFTKKEWYIFFGFLIILFISTLGILQNINKSFMVSIPMEGGHITEGIVGTPRFVNPILATGDADRDLVTLIYAGLMRKNTDGSLIPDLAQEFTISKDGLVYTFILKDKIYFHDDTPVTVDDIIFTIEKIKDTLVKSPLKSNWDGINVTKIDEKTIQFTLKQPYASFLENTTLGILPKKVWDNTTPIELNTANINPIGAGPFEVNSLKKQPEGIVDYYELKAFKKFNLGKPYIKNITLRFYQNEEDVLDALSKKEIDQASSISPESAQKLSEKDYRIESSVLPRIFGLFFNQNQNQIFTNKNVIQAMDLAIDKDAIVRQVLSGYGISIDSPIPPNMINYQKLDKTDTSTYEDKKIQAEKILEKDGWTKNSEGFLEKTITEKKKKTTTTLEFSISTGNATELASAAELIKSNLQDIGIKVEIKTFEVGNLNQIVIRPRKYDALLFGQIINHESDLFAFWHSTQRKDPGLNVAMYTNSKVDKILEDAFITVNEQNRIKKYAQFEDEIKKDMPAVFLYSPNFIYIVSKDLQNISIDHMISPRDRFLSSYLWYIKTDNVWKIFSKN